MRYVNAQHADHRHHLSVGGALAVGVLLGGVVSIVVMSLTAYLLRMLA